MKVINHSSNPLPAHRSAWAAGVDLQANLETPVVLKPMQRAVIPTGLFIELPQGFEAQIRPRSGLAAKHGITVLNSPGTIDADYRGELKVILINLSNQEYKIEHGERICQMIVSKHETVQWQEADTLADSEINLQY